MQIILRKHFVDVPAFLQGWVMSGELNHARNLLERFALRAGVKLTEEQRMRINECWHLPTLDRWIENAISAKSGDDVFGEG